MIQTQVYEGTPDQLAKQFSKLPKTRKYKVTVTSVEPDATEKQKKLITFGMFPQLQALNEEDFESAEWRGEEIDL